MKVYPVILMLVLCATACFQYSPNSNHATAVPESLLEEARKSVPFFEIYHETSGPWTVSGKTLFFRLYKNGVAEFDYLDASKIKEGVLYKAEEVVNLRPVRVRETDFQKFQKLFDSADFQKDFEILKTKYEGRSCTEGSSIYKIVLMSGEQSKSVEISPVCSLNELTNRDMVNSADIPVTLSELIRLASVTQLKHAYRK